MKKLILLILLSLPMVAVAQESQPLKWSITPSYGIFDYGNTHPFNRQQYAGLRVGYEILPNWQVEISGLYGFGDNSVYNAVFSIGRRLITLNSGNRTDFYLDVSFGMGYQYVESVGGMLTVPVIAKIGIPITRNFIVGFEAITAVNKKDAALVSEQWGVSLTVRF